MLPQQLTSAQTAPTCLLCNARPARLRDTFAPQARRGQGRAMDAKLDDERLAAQRLGEPDQARQRARRRRVQLARPRQAHKQHAVRDHAPQQPPAVAQIPAHMGAWLCVCVSHVSGLASTRTTPHQPYMLRSAARCRQVTLSSRCLILVPTQPHTPVRQRTTHSWRAWQPAAPPGQPAATPTEAAPRVQTPQAAQSLQRGPPDNIRPQRPTPDPALYLWMGERGAVRCCGAP